MSLIRLGVILTSRRSMSNSRIILTNLDRAIALSAFYITADRPVMFGQTKPPPYQAAWAAKNWAWLAWQQGDPFESISDRLISVLRNIVLLPDMVAEADENQQRGRFNWFVLICAVLSADEPTIGWAAEQTSYATKRAPDDRYFKAVAGIVRARVLGDAAEEKRQLEISKPIVPEEPEIGPSRLMLQAFVDRNYSLFLREMTKGVKKHWSDRFMGTKPGRRVLISVSRSP
jgi:hypothetical protein